MVWELQRNLSIFIYRCEDFRMEKQQRATDINRMGDRQNAIKRCGTMFVGKTISYILKGKKISKWNNNVQSNTENQQMRLYIIH